MSALFFRHAFSDFLSLGELERGNIPSVSDLRRRLFVLERRYDPARPDHFYNAYLEERFRAAVDIWDFPDLVLSALAERFLETRRGRQVVKREAFADWQNAIGSLSPLALLVHATAHDPELRHRAGADPGPMLEAVLGGSACAAPFLPALDDLIDREGLYDAHMHLNGSTEVDVVWADAVMRPRAYLKIFNGTSSGAAVKELFDQIESGLSALTIFGRLRAARRVRHLTAREIRRLEEGGPPSLSVKQLLEAMDLKRSDSEFPDLPPRVSRSPYLTIFPGAETRSPLVAEAAFLFTCFEAARRRPELRDVVGLALWHSFTVFSQVARLTVQQVDQTGFHQFDKFTAAGARDSVERAYKARFGQLNGSGPTGDLAYMDGRFAPKDTPARTVDLLGRVVDGLLSYRRCPRREGGRGLAGKAPDCLKGPCTCDQRKDRMDVALVAHFVKKADDVPKLSPAGEPSTTAHGRHVNVRRGLAKQYRALRRVLDRSEIARTIVRGIDGAGNELDAPPEIFAPTYRALRESGDVVGASFHVGEDFVHLVSGVRAVEESVRFLGLAAGDRVGHAVALGVEPEIWSDRIGDRVLIRDEDRLDDAVYTLGVLRDAGERFADEARLQHVVEVLSDRIYGEQISLSELERAWKIRDLDILTVLLLEETYDGDPRDAGAFALHARSRCDEFVDRDRRREALRIARTAEADPRAFGLYRRRHAPEVRARGARYNECRVAARDGLFAEISLPVLHLLQTHGLKLLKRRGVVIETLPTSNVRIGAYKDHSEHHLLRWMDLQGTSFGFTPEVCLGSDDPGIFSTNARNEFAHVLLALEKRISTRETIEHLKRLNSAGRTSRFAYAPPRRPAKTY